MRGWREVEGREAADVRSSPLSALLLVLHTLEFSDKGKKRDLKAEDAVSCFWMQ